MATIWNASDKSANITLFRNALMAASGVTAGTWKGVRATNSLSSGLKYLEFYCCGYKKDNGWICGFANSSWSTASFVGSDGNSIGYQVAIGAVYKNGSSFATIQAHSLHWGYVIACAIDLGNKLIWFRTDRNTNWNNSGTANPATGVGGLSYGATGAMFPAFSGLDATLSNQCSINAGGLPFALAVPSGFSAWDTASPTVLGLTGTHPSTFDPSNKDSHITLSNSDRTAANSTATNNNYGVKSKNTYGGGLIYLEFDVGTFTQAGSLSPIFLGFSQTGASNTVNPGQNFLSSSLQIGTAAFGGFTGAYINGSRDMAASTWNSAANDKIGVAIWFDKGLWWAKNITQASNWNADAGADPVAGLKGWAIQVPDDYAYLHLSQNALNGTITETINFGAAVFAGAIPSGYSRWEPLATNDPGPLQTAVSMM